MSEEKKVDVKAEVRALLDRLPDALGLPFPLWSDEAIAAWFAQQGAAVPPRLQAASASTSRTVGMPRTGRRKTSSMVLALCSATILAPGA